MNDENTEFEKTPQWSKSTRGIKILKELKSSKKKHEFPNAGISDIAAKAIAEALPEGLKTGIVEDLKKSIEKGLKEYRKKGIVEAGIAKNFSLKDWLKALELDSLIGPERVKEIEQEIEQIIDKNMLKSIMERIVKKFSLKDYLKDLNVENNFIGSEGLKAIVEHLDCLFRLNLRVNNLTDLKLLGEKLKTNATLKYLNLSANNLGDKAVKQLALGLKTNTFLEELRLWGNKIGDEGLRHIVEALVNNYSLKSLRIFGNNITDKEIQFLTEQFAHKTCITELSVWGNNIGNEGESLINIMCEHNTAFENVRVNFNSNTDILKGILSNNSIIRDTTDSKEFYNALQRKKLINTEFTLLTKMDSLPWEALAKWLREGTGQIVKILNIVSKNINNDSLETLISECKNLDLIINLNGIELSCSSIEQTKAIEKQPEESLKLEADEANIAFDRLTVAGNVFDYAVAPDQLMGDSSDASADEVIEA